MSARSRYVAAAVTIALLAVAFISIGYAYMGNANTYNEGNNSTIEYVILDQTNFTLTGNDIRFDVYTGEEGTFYRINNAVDFECPYIDDKEYYGVAVGRDTLRVTGVGGFGINDDIPISVLTYGSGFTDFSGYFDWRYVLKFEGIVNGDPVALYAYYDGFSGVNDEDIAWKVYKNSNWSDDGKVELRNNVTYDVTLYFAGVKETVNDGSSYVSVGSTVIVSDDVILRPIWEVTSDDDVKVTMRGESEEYIVYVPNGGRYMMPEGFEPPSGMVFVGWKSGNTGKVYASGYTFSNITEDVVFTAQFADNDVQVTFDANGGSGDIPEPVDLHYGDTFALSYCPITPPEGKLFAGWEVDSVAMKPGDIITVTSDVVVKALWGDYVLPVNFDANGGTGTFGPEWVSYDGTYVLPDSPFTKAGNAFKGWKVGNIETIRQPGYSITHITEDTTVQAQWESGDGVSITLDKNGGTGGDTIIVKVVSGSDYILPACTYTAPAEKEFRGWRVDGVLREPGYKLENVTSAVTATAVWDLDTTITFAAGTGATGSMDPVTVASGTIYELPNCTFTAPEGKVFSGWSISAVTYYPKETVTVTSNITATAQWAETGEGYIVVSFNSSGGTGNMLSVRIPSGSTYTVPDCGFTPISNRGFVKWSVDLDGNEENGREVIKYPGDTIVLSSNVEMYAEWGQTKTQTFTANGGIGVMSWNVAVGQQFVLPENAFASPSNKAFYGWKVSGVEGVKHPGDVITIASSTEITALWGYKPYVVSFIKNDEGASGTMESLGVTSALPLRLPACTFTAPEGEEFKGWKVGNEGALLQPGDNIMIDGDKALYAQWGILQIVSFNGNGGTGEMSSVKVEKDTDYVLPECGYTLTGYRFAGWKVNNAGTMLLPGDELTIGADKVLYAQWRTPNTVSFNRNGGNGSMADVGMATGMKFILPDSTFEAPVGKVFAGWMVDNMGSTLAPGTVIDVNGEIELYAQWRVPYTITFFGGEGSSGSMDPVTVASGSAYILPNNISFTKTDYVFKGWKVDNDGSLLPSGEKLAIYGNKNLYAQWESGVGVTVSFNMNGGSGSVMANIIVASDSQCVLPDCTFTAPAGKTFAGWKVSNAGALLQPGAKITVDATKELYAQWETSASITFNVNGGSGSMSPVTVASGSTYILPNNSNFTAPAGKAFAGWKVGNAGATFLPGDKITINGDKVLYAQWENLMSTVKIYDYSGVNYTTVNMEYGTSYTIPYNMFEPPSVPDEGFNGWTFKGWSNTGSPSTRSTTSMILTVICLPSSIPA